MENLNQTLKIVLRAYVNEGLDNWVDLLTGFCLSYNTAIHSSTGYSPTFLLRGFHPRTPNTTLPLILDKNKGRRPDATEFLDPDAREFTEDLVFFHNLAKDTLRLAQSHQEKYYNNGHLLKEFAVGDYVLINLHSLHLLRGFKGKGKKLLPRFEGPYKITGKISTTAYRL